MGEGAGVGTVGVGDGNVGANVGRGVAVGASATVSTAVGVVVASGSDSSLADAVGGLMVAGGDVVATVGLSGGGGVSPGMAITRGVGVTVPTTSNASLGADGVAVGATGICVAMAPTPIVTAPTSVAARMAKARRQGVRRGDVAPGGRFIISLLEQSACARRFPCRRAVTPRGYQTHPFAVRD